MQRADSKQHKLIYGLDIGTRSIVGTVGYMEKDHFVVVAQKVREHETRAMLDGQIHDIGAVGEMIRDVTDELEKELDITLSQVCIAAAGRVLQTVTTSVEIDLEGEKLITKEDIFALDSYGIEKAYEEFQKENELDMKFYCVGYTVMRYYMNHYPMSNLENHKAKIIAADLIATFLPDDVVDGLYKAVELAGLEVANLTLEPIQDSEYRSDRCRRGNKRYLHYKGRQYCSIWYAACCRGLPDRRYCQTLSGRFYNGRDDQTRDRA